jgi:uncharacterized protein
VTAQDPVRVPVQYLSPELLRKVVETFVLREGTDYGTHERTLDEKVADVIRQLNDGSAEIVYDPDTESVDIVVTPPPR